MTHGTRSSLAAPFRAVALAAALLAAALPGAAPGPAAAAETVTVATAEALSEALAGAQAGDTILLSPGDYGVLRLGRGQTFDPPLTLRAADPAERPVVTGMDVREVTGLVLDGLRFDYTYSAEHTQRLRSFSITGSDRITLRNSVFDGDRARGRSADDDGFGFSIGLSITYSRDVLVENNEIFDFHRGAAFRGCARLTIRGNDIHGIRMDGMNFAQVRDVLIENNTIRDFNRSLGSKDHADMIQFWTARTSEPSTGIIIRGNVLDSGLGGFTQSIFMRNEAVDRGASDAMFYRDLTIEENVIINAHLHGISVGQTVGLRIRNNTLVHNPRSAGDRPNRPLWVPMIRVHPGARDVAIEGNIVPEIKGHDGQADWRVAGNLMIQHQNAGRPNHYDRVFANALRGDPRNLSNYAYRPGGPADAPGLGASRLRGGVAAN